MQCQVCTMGVRCENEATHRLRRTDSASLIGDDMSCCPDCLGLLLKQREETDPYGRWSVQPLGDLGKVARLQEEVRRLRRENEALHDKYDGVRFADDVHCTECGAALNVSARKVDDGLCHFCAHRLLASVRKLLAEGKGRS